MKYKLEVIAFNIESCIAAQRSGADRIELCDNPGEGGTTPSYSFIKAARKVLQIDLFVMIRPRGGDFQYSEEDFSIMKNDIVVCKELGADGIVFGILTKEGKVDIKKCKELLDLAYPMYCTFHRAFDRVADPFRSLEDLIDLGFERILTSGLQPKALDGADTITSLIRQSAGRIIIMPGSGISSENILEVAGITGALEFHSSSRKISSKESYMNPFMNEVLQYTTINEEEVEKIAGKIKNMEGNALSSEY
ncbi:MAG: copper homeostasis protein CutC [Ginsengibacter sp.]